MTKAASRCAAPALVLAALVLLPFLGKAFTIDDTLFLKQAEHLLTDPLHPTAFEAFWSELAAPLVVLAVVLVTPDPAGPFAALAGSARTFSPAANLGRNVTAFMVHWTLVLPLALPWAMLRWRALLRQPVLYVMTLAAGIMLRLEGEAHRLFVIAPAAGLGAGVLWDVLAGEPQPR